MTVCIPTLFEGITCPPTSKATTTTFGTVSQQRAPNDPGNFSFKFTVTDDKNTSITGYEWRIYEDDVTPGVLGTLELAGEESSIVDNHEFKYYTASTLTIVLQIIHDDYEEYNLTLSLTGAPIDTLVVLNKEFNK